MPRRVLALSFLLSLCVLLLHSFALKHYLYWHFWWYDLLIHFFAGTALSLVAFFVLQDRNMNYSQVAFQTLLCVLICSIGWELFEAYYHIALIASANYFVDTVSDIGMGMLGGIMGVLFCLRYSRKNPQELQRRVTDKKDI